ncbi:hypothetical protein LX36DRAFT_80431 [Colletotrichum falcatum]|nr:hypothetical protein LX36DRAFT_80431 [Colletotrichum falcatum]
MCDATITSALASQGSPDPTNAVQPAPNPPELLLPHTTETAGGCPVCQEKQMSQKQIDLGVFDLGVFDLGICQAGREREGEKPRWPLSLVCLPSLDVSDEEMPTLGEAPARLAFHASRPLLRICAKPRPVCGPFTEPHGLICIMENRDLPEQPVGVEKQVRCFQLHGSK